LSKATEAGLFHPNCEVIHATWFPGINTLPTIPDPERSEKWYKAGQRQRSLERAIREEKNTCRTLDEENLIGEKKRLRELQRQLMEHFKNNSQLRRKPEREG